ncbi:Transcriptional regulator, contains XRE-family HTH domain [Nocardia amikacinitolerans]|uniref:helix-turn-helix domain-containing protein n=1 Tax=Nocardia amikacinitolerans TaxID=756689 RepID=UPI0020A4C14D|nr:helix-turn-helix transcriptional regulator [Nocardia amikacinitolerans]MCP2318311.1 Transcriptional regulator, contains XRE-family HTH domain [Nocardia amikacinitolerans]
MENGSRIGPLLREWRQRRRLSQLDLALAADSSARHVSYLENGRAAPSRAMVLRLCEALDVPLRERNTLLLAAGFAPAYRESHLDDAELTAVRSAVATMLAAHEPYPAVVVDRWWNVVTGNSAMSVLTAGVPEHLLTPRPNVYRLVLHPDGLIARLANPVQVRELFLERLGRQAEATGDERLRALYDEVLSYPAPSDPAADRAAPTGPFQVPVRIRTPLGEMAMFSTMATFGAPADVTLSELAIELFYPLDEFTAAVLRGTTAVNGSTGKDSDRAESGADAADGVDGGEDHVDRREERR